MKMVSLVAQDQTDSRKNLDGFAIPDCSFWSMDCSWVGVCGIRVFLIHLRLVNRTLLEQMVDIMAIGITRADHR